MWSATFRWNTASGLPEVSEDFPPATQGQATPAPPPEVRAGPNRPRAVQTVLLAMAITALVLVINQLDGIIDTGRWLILAWAAPLSFLVVLGLVIVSWRVRGHGPRGELASSRGHIGREGRARLGQPEVIDVSIKQQ